MSAVGVFSTPGGYHEYTGKCSVHEGIIISTLGDTRCMWGLL